MLPIADPRSERGRICAAVLELIGEGGYAAVTLFEVERRTGLEEAEIRAHFSDLDECVTAIWRDFDAELEARLGIAWAASGDWRETMRTSLGVLLDLVAQEPAAARLYVVESFFAGEEGSVRRQQMIERLSALIERAPIQSPKLRPQLVAEAIAGGIWQHIHQQIRDGRAGELRRQLPELMYFTVLPILGSEAAQAELRVRGDSRA